MPAKLKPKKPPTAAAWKPPKTLGLVIPIPAAKDVDEAHQKQRRAGALTGALRKMNR